MSYSLVLYMHNINPLVISFFMYTGNNLCLIRTDVDVAGKATKLSNLTSLPSFL